MKTTTRTQRVFTLADFNQHSNEKGTKNGFGHKSVFLPVQNTIDIWSGKKEQHHKKKAVVHKAQMIKRDI